MKLCNILISTNYPFIVIQIADVSMHITGGVDIYLYGCVSLLAPVCNVCLCVCDIKSEFQQKTDYVLDLSK